MHHRSLLLLLALATLSLNAPAQSGSVDGNAPLQPAPIERSAHDAGNITSSRPIPGVVLRSARNTEVKTVSATGNVAELRLDHGRANVSVRHPENGAQILVDLPGGQTALLKDGLYTFNADTNTVRVLKGEAKAFPTQDDKGIKVKEYHQLVLSGPNVRSVEVDPVQARADLLPSARPRAPRYGDGDGPYGDGYGYYPYAGYAYGYPYGFYGYPYGYGYPFGFGIGFGYYGGFRGGFGGFRGHR